jgi:hypothetical protein
MTEDALAEIKCTLDKMLSNQSEMQSIQTEMKADARLTDAKVDNIGLLIGERVENLNGRMAKAETNIEHGEKARLQLDKAISAQFGAQQKEIDRKVVEQPQMDAITVRLEGIDDRLMDLVGERRTEKAIRNILFGGLGVAWAAIIAIVSAWVAHSGLFGH